MASIVDKDGVLADFLADPSPSVVDATRALDAARRLLEATPSSDLFTDDDYRIVERTLNRASNAATSTFVQEALRGLFAQQPPTCQPLPR